MRNLILFGLLVILLLAAQFASAKTVDEIIEKYIRARGGKDKLATMKSIYMEGIKEIITGQVTVKVIKEQDRFSRTEIKNGIATGFMLIRDKDAWTYFPLRSPSTDKIPDADVPGLPTELDIAGPLVDYTSKGHKAELLGRETVEGNPCYKIKLITNTGREMMFWVDAVTYLLNQSSVLSIPDGSGPDRETFTLYRNYKEVEGVLFAHTCETRTPGRNTAWISEEIFFYDIQVNPAIDAEMFLPE